MTQPQFIDALVTNHYVLSTRDVGNMYQKYIDEKIFPQKPEHAQYLVITTNRMGKLDMTTSKILYENKKANFDEYKDKEIVHLDQAAEHAGKIDSPYMLYQAMEILDREKENYLSINYTWLKPKENSQEKKTNALEQLMIISRN